MQSKEYEICMTPKIFKCDTELFHVYSDKLCRKISHIFVTQYRTYLDRVLQECRHQHPQLSELDAIYGFACGEKNHIFMSHLDCIQRSHVESFRLAICEDSAHRALRFIESGSFDLEEKQARLDFCLQ